MSLNDVKADAVLARRWDLFSAGAHARVRDGSACSGIVLQGTYDDYLKTMFRHNARLNLKKKINKALDEKKLTYVVVGPGDAITERVADLFMLHEQRAADKDIRSTFTSEKLKAFHSSLSLQLCAKGMLDFHLLYDGAKPVSAGYAFRYKRKLFFYQTGMDPAWSAASVGTVILALLIRKAFADGLAEFDFLKGDHAYKRHWTNARSRQFRLAAYRRGLLGSALFFLTGAREVAKRFRRRIPPNGLQSHVGTLAH